MVTETISEDSKPAAQDAEAKPSFMDELKTLWASLPGRGYFVAAAVAWFGLFHFLGNSTFGYVETDSLFGWMNWVYEGNADEAHGQLIPFVVVVLLWMKRKEIIESPKKVWLPALALVLFCLVSHYFGYVIQQTRLSLIGFFAGLYGLVGLFFGPAMMRRIFFPYFLFAFCMPLGSMGQELTVPLRGISAVIASFFAKDMLGIEVMRVGTQIFDSTGTIKFDVAAACSGIRSLITIIALTTIYGFITFKAYWKRALIISTAIPLAVAGNVIRITGVIIIAEAFGQEAGMTFHDWAGFFTFTLAFGAVLGLGWLLEEKRPKSPKLEEVPA